MEFNNLARPRIAEESPKTDTGFALIGVFSSLDKTFEELSVSVYATTGLQTLGELPRGSHVCQFFSDGADLRDTLVPYFKAGLENNERCLLVAMCSAVNQLSCLDGKGQGGKGGRPRTSRTGPNERLWAAQAPSLESAA
jgi:hypothetical protein